MNKALMQVVIVLAVALAGFCVGLTVGHLKRRAVKRAVHGEMHWQSRLATVRLVTLPGTLRASGPRVSGSHFER